MAYYDQFVEDPNAALDKIAGQRGMSRHELDKRLELIASEAKSGAHLTLGEVKYYIENAESLGAELSAHANSCAYCADMIAALLPANVDGKLAKLKSELEKHRAAAVTAARAVPAAIRNPTLDGNSAAARERVFRWKPQLVYGCFIVLLAGNIAAGVALVNSHRQIDALNTQVALYEDLRSVNHNYVADVLPKRVDSTAPADPPNAGVPPVIQGNLVVHPASQKTAADFVASWLKEGPHRLYVLKPDPMRATMVASNTGRDQAADHLVLADSGLTAKCMPSAVSKTDAEKGAATTAKCEMQDFDTPIPAASRDSSASVSSMPADSKP